MCLGLPDAANDDVDHYVLKIASMYHIVIWAFRHNTYVFTVDVMFVTSTAYDIVPFGVSTTVGFTHAGNSRRAQGTSDRYARHV